MQIVDIHMPPRSSKTTALITMLKGFNQDGIQAVYLGTEAQCYYVMKYRGIPAEWTLTFGRLTNCLALHEIPKNILIDDSDIAEVNYKKYIGSNLREDLTNLPLPDHYAYLFGSYPMISIDINSLSDDEMKRIKTAIAESNAELRTTQSHRFGF